MEEWFEDVQVYIFKFLSLHLFSSTFTIKYYLNWGEYDSNFDFHFNKRIAFHFLTCAIPVYVKKDVLKFELVKVNI